MESSDNERIKALYGDYCFWSWLRYWHLDSTDYITSVSIDKPYYDYDYEYVKPRQEFHEQSKERDERIMRKFGFGRAGQDSRRESIQNIIRKETATK